METIELGPEESRNLAYVLANPPPPTPKLVRLFRELEPGEAEKLVTAKAEWDRRYRDFQQTGRSEA